MKDTFIDVPLELDMIELARQPDPAQFVKEASREAADRLCEQHGARLRTDRAPEIYITKGQNKETGQLCVLVATRWACVAPENVPMGPPDAR